MKAYILWATLAVSLISSANAATSVKQQMSVDGAPNGAVVNFTQNTTTGRCGSILAPPNTITAQTDFSVTYTVNGASYPLTGGATYSFPCTINFVPADPTTTAATMNLPSTYQPGSNCSIYFDPFNTGVSLRCTASPSIQGFINPKYVVMGVTYAPPGSSSYVQYTNTTSIGNTTTIANSFQNNVGFSVSASGAVKAGFLIGGSFTLTATASNNIAVGSNSSTTTTLSKAATISYLTGGTPTASPVNNDYDYIWIWINPEVVFTYTPPVGSTPAAISWNGYAFDPNDPVSGLPPASGTYNGGPDIIEVAVGCLNGHFSCPSTLTWLNGAETAGSYVTSGALARTWASSANGYQWPAGEVSGLTFSDVCTILTFDPLAQTPSQCPVQNNYSLLSKLPSTTSDGRFTQETNPPNPLQYAVGAPTEQFSLVQTNTQSVANGTTKQITQAFSVEAAFKTNWFDIFKSTTTLKQSDTLTWNYSTLNTLTTTNTVTNALSITGPPFAPPYSGPVRFIAYQDNLFGTFAFVPVQ